MQSSNTNHADSPKPPQANPGGSDQPHLKSLHPSLAPLPKADFATLKANQRAAQKPSKIKIYSAPTEFANIAKNPYFDPALGSHTAAPHTRKRRGFHFVPQGRYTQEANQLRAQALLEKLKKDIAEKISTAGIEGDKDTMTDRWLRKPPPPEVEWWDAPLLANKDYADLDNNCTLIDSPDSLITVYVQHPIPTHSVVHEPKPTSQPLFLTKKERKKLRRQRRAELQRERQDKIRLGLLPPDPPKVKLSNLMHVLANESVQDPTKVAAEVRRQVTARQEEHERINRERQLTDEERRAKKQAKLAEDEARGISCLVFKVQNLSHPQHKYKVDTNAQQLNLTGVAIMNPIQGLVVVEGGAKSLKAYKKLMLRRIEWDLSTENSDDNSDTDSEDESMPPSGPTAASGSPARATGPNFCALLWEGQVPERRFKHFRFRLCPTESKALACLASGQADQFWALGKQIEAADSAQHKTQI
ncbi:pre-mRNA processing factor 3-domain-containing protein [Dimargaris cristalligena]|uniref:Pre-mRNA processing factor 3-domain-containing protein n=1 Tax=Dimargaris cristalligena TaxID=215637 RepID=A0A4P9ZS03_9FUNG|nr:pre-mRNA processing factor 3-domain-containing protein [Dimargaris cristalligena]|eukprot:RKP36336.1 pre-mRNA processing factor 3-domain-containing protein [Dimargaris cristalligena]